MNQLTLRQARPQVAAVCGTSGMSVTDARVDLYINNAILELMFTGDYPNVVDRWLFRVDQASGLIALPYLLDRLMQVTVDDVPLSIVSPWYEFVQYGPGVEDDYDASGNVQRSWIDVVKDRGDMPTVKPIPDPVNVPTGPWILRVYAAVAEASGAVLNIQGLDTDGLIIRTYASGAWYNGLNVAINNAVPYTETTQEFSRITGIVKPLTNGYVRLTAWNGTDEVELSNYAFNETTPSYRHYYIPRMHNRGYSGVRERVLLARCRKRFVPAKEDNDVLIISNVEALKEMVIAQWHRLTDNAAYLMHRQTAVQIMREESMGYRGKSRVPSLTFQRGFAVGAVQYIR